MAHKTLINGAAYDIVGGSTLVDGTGRKISKGITLIDGTKREIVFDSGWQWGSETDIADATWWEGLHNFLQGAKSNEEVASIIKPGMKKMVTLTKSIAGSTTHSIMVIGVNEDADKTVTFHTTLCLKYKCQYGSSNSWNTSYLRNTNCANYYEAFPGKTYIVPVRKIVGLASKTTIYTEKVFLLSANEVGYLKGSSPILPNWNEFTQGKSAPYSYYANATPAQRSKTLEDGGNTQYWTRTMSYYEGQTEKVVGITTAGINIFAPTDSRGFAPAFVIG